MVSTRMCVILILQDITVCQVDHYYDVDTAISWPSPLDHSTNAIDGLGAVQGLIIWDPHCCQFWLHKDGWSSFR